ncbi:hypothetical protein [Acinetobacter bereziniae]|nr:hypothetical protein [Acinetobacter bereziniae]
MSLSSVATALSATPTLQYSKTYDECTHAAKQQPTSKNVSVQSTKVRIKG